MCSSPYPWLCLSLNLERRRGDWSKLIAFLCLGDDLTYFFVAEWRAEDVHADVGGYSPQLGHVSGKKAPPLDILEEAFETAGGECRCEADTLGTISPPGVRTELRQK